MARKATLSVAANRDDAPVLIGILKSKRDLVLLLRERWYRIPAAEAPQRTFRYIAFYQPAAFGHEGKLIRYYARVLRRKTRLRRDLLPGEGAHPRASEPYYRIAVERVRRLARPIRNIHPRRVTFGFTTLGRLKRAKHLLDLYGVRDTEALVGATLQRAGISAIPQRYVTGDGKRYRLDFAIYCKRGAIAIECDNAKAHRGAHRRTKDRAKDIFLARRGWTVIRLREREIVSGIAQCIARVRRAIKRLGGLAAS